MKPFGKIIWQDLTVDNAEEVKNFYCEVVGWEFDNHSQGEYNDFNMKNSDTQEVVAGICHKRGPLVNLPAQWLNYVTVENLETSLEKCTSLGGQIVDGPKAMGKAQFAVIQDPAGAYMVLYQE